MRVDMKFLDYSLRRNCDAKEVYLILEDEFVNYKIVATYELYDEAQGIWIDKRANYRWQRKRKALSEVNMSFDNTEHQWSIGIDFEGVADGNSWLFDDPKEALSIYNILHQYQQYVPIDKIKTTIKI